MKITLTVNLKYKWFFWPCFCVCYAAARIGADAERMAGFLARHCMTMDIK